MTLHVSKLALAAIVLASGIAAAETPQITLSRPAEQRPGCLAEEMRIPRETLAHLPDSANLEFTVSAEGRILGVASDANVGRGLDTQFRGALSRCAWTPATDLGGVPVARRVRVPIRFESAGDSGRVVARVGAFEPVAVASR
jgi:hypothetical protein